MRRYKINMWAIDKYVSSKERYFNPGYTIGREYTMGYRFRILLQIQNGVIMYIQEAFGELVLIMHTLVQYIILLISKGGN